MLYFGISVDFPAGSADVQISADFPAISQYDALRLFQCFKGVLGLSFGGYAVFLTHNLTILSEYQHFNSKCISDNQNISKIGA